MRLKTLLEFLLERNVSQPEGRKDDPLGQYVFASLRNDVPTPKEPDTDIEKVLASAYNKHFHGRPEELQNYIDIILDLADDYPSFFEVPERYQKAYRTLTLPPRILEGLLGRPLTKEDYNKEIHVENQGVQQPYGGKNFFSWTVRPEIFYGLKKDWSSLFSTDWIRKRVGSKGFVVFIRADVNSNTFFNNPEKMKKTGLAGQFSYQMEVISVGEVNLDKIVYFYFDDETDVDAETTLIKDAISLLK